MDGRTIDKQGSGRFDGIYNQRYVFSQEEFKRMMIKQEQENLPSRIRLTMLRNSIPGDQPYTRKLYLYWTDKEKHIRPICVRFSLGSEFSPSISRTLNEQNLAQLVAGFNRGDFRAKQKYLNMSIDEVAAAGSQDVTLLTMWLTLDSFVGGVGSLNAGQNINTGETLRIYNYFAEFFKIENLFICDEVELNDRLTEKALPLRVISALATGKTWLQSGIPGLKMVDVRHFSVTPTDAIHQNATARNAELEELQKLTLERWHEMLDQNQRIALTVLYERLFPKRRSSAVFFKRTSTATKESIFGEDTVQTLAEIIYKEVEDKLQITDNFKLLHELLTGHSYLQYGNIPLNRNSNDFWVKSRVQRLLWGSYVWRHESVGKTPAEVIRQSRN